jgi:hypothetical protein
MCCMSSFTHVSDDCFEIDRSQMGYHVLTQIFHGFLQSVQADAEIVTRLGHECFLPNCSVILPSNTVWLRC